MQSKTITAKAPSPNIIFDRMSACRWSRDLYTPKVLPDKVKTLAAHLHSTKAGLDTKLTAHVPGKLMQHGDIHSLSVVPEPIDEADTSTLSLFLHLSADEAPATAIGADDQRLSPYLPLHPKLAGTVPAPAAGEMERRVDERIYRTVPNILANAYVIVTFGSCI